MTWLRDMLAVCGALTVCLLVSPAQAEWEPFEGIDGGAVITKNPPSGASSTNLHCSVNGNPESATFTINIDDVTDMDKCQGVIEDARIENGATLWTCTSGAGTMTSNGLAGTFVPSASPRHGIQIHARLEEGHNRSYLYRDPGEDPERRTYTWGSTLTTFIVGVRMQPGNIKHWETGVVVNWTQGTDDGGYVFNTLYTTTDLETLDVDVPWTGTLQTPGAVTDEQNGLQVKTPTWTALAESDAGAVTIMGSVKYSPAIDALGYVDIEGDTDGPTDLGILGEIFNQLKGKITPSYVAAAAKVLVEAVGTKTHWKYGFTGESVMENVDVSKLDRKDEGIGDLLDATTLEAIFVFDTDHLADPGVELKGSAHVASLVEGYDDCALSKVTVTIAVVDDPVMQEDAEVWQRNKRPSYKAP